MRSSFVDALIEEARKNPKIILLTGDLGFGVLKPFIDELPNQFINCGIAEANMISFASGLSSQGYIPIVYSIGNFPTIRVLEQIRNDVCYPNANVKIVCIGGGYTYGTLGATHHATEDIAVMRALPNMKIYAPSSKKEAMILTRKAILENGPVYLRFERNSNGIFDTCIDPKNPEKPAKIIENNCKTAIFSFGTILEELIKLKNTDIYSVPVIKPIDTKTFAELLKKYNHVITVEEHTKIGGLGDAIASIIVENNINVKFDKFGINDEFPSLVASQNILRAYEHLSVEDIQVCIDKGSK